MDIRPIARPFVVLLVVSAGAAGSISAQSGSISVVEPRRLAGVHSCRAPHVEEGEAWSTVFAARAMDENDAGATLARLHDSLRLEAVASPRDVDVQYLTAVVAGLRADLEGGRSAVRHATEMYRRAQAVLDIEPGHPGAHHLVGRLHAAVLRMDGFTRFVATRLFGGGELAGASWEEARLRLERAVTKAPCVPDHYYELARLYAERGEERSAVDALRDLLLLAGPEGPYADVYRKGRRLLERLEDRT